ncbi:putative acyl carrier protein [Aerococcus christensenii]|uniref:Acyl carrier protein n=2 Tax=Aerococcus christensenii TaxID=87541 RepID=A0A133XYQ2_9LACT|nr:putative acyl carrier protein [Aerococcus christensenii]
MEEDIMTTFEIIQGLICDQLDLKKEEVQPTTRLQEELDADSLDIFQIINDIEDEFEISIDEEDMDLETVQDLVDYVEKKK